MIWLNTSFTGGAIFFHVFWHYRTFRREWVYLIMLSGVWFLSHSKSSVSGSYSGIETIAFFLYLPPLELVSSDLSSLRFGNLNMSWNSSFTFEIKSKSAPREARCLTIDLVELAGRSRALESLMFSPSFERWLSALYYDRSLFSVCTFLVKLFATLAWLLALPPVSTVIFG